MFGLLLPCLVSCTGRGSRDEDVQRRADWIAGQTTSNKLWVRDLLSRAGDSDFHDAIFYDGWYPTESDAKTGGAWRWMGKHGVIRLRTKPGGARTASDMHLKLFGWVPHDLMPVHQLRLELAVNGHILGRIDPPAHAFEHTVAVPRSLLDNSDWVDFSITVTNTIMPSGDWRDLGFATTGFQWTPIPAN
jgi:hypothetical protein